ncbi:MAG: rRNA maturation RNase YbeY [Minisyncoccia bacterium]|jgi:probable rRNA maturation factor
MSAHFDIINRTRASIPRARFRAIKDSVLGSDYRLDLAFIGSGDIRKLNLTYRNKDEATDVLSFPISRTEGEICISPTEARKEARRFGRSYENFVALLFIHGCVHLKGYAHGATMERMEARIRRAFKV